MPTNPHQPPDGTDTIRIDWRLDAEGCEPLQRAFDRLLRAGEHVVRIDLAEVGFISSAGLGALAECHRRLAALGGRLEVVAASEPVRRVLKLTKLDTLIGPRSTTVGPAEEDAPATGGPGEMTCAGVKLTTISPPSSRPLEARVRSVVLSAGRPPDLSHRSAATRLGPTSFAVGLGSPDTQNARPGLHDGELLAAAGHVFHRPPSTDPRIDYLVPKAGWMPEIALLQGLSWEGTPSGSAGFAPGDGMTTVPLDGLAAALLDVTFGSADTGARGSVPDDRGIGFLAVGEVHGLVGAELVRPLAESTSDDVPLGAGAVVTARWLSFSREPVHGRRTALLVGVAFRGPPDSGPLAGQMRPLGPAPGGPVGHVHAAVFDYRPIRRTPGPLMAIVAELAVAPPLAVMHLLVDPAPLFAAGRSELVRGVAWFAPLHADSEMRA
jgi:anti-sigma B factor antagonist